MLVITYEWSLWINYNPINTNKGNTNNGHSGKQRTFININVFWIW